MEGLRMEWQDTFSIGNQQLDSQHKKWIELYNRLDAIMVGKDSQGGIEKRGEILKEMSDYVGYHFECEEEFMRSINYPNLEKHWRLHKNFRNIVDNAYREMQEGKLILGSEILSMLRRWMYDHITREDVKIRDFLAEQAE